MKSEWWVEGPMGEEAVLLSVRLEYWYMATAALSNQAKPPDFLCADTTLSAADKTQHHQHKQFGTSGIGGLQRWSLSIRSRKSC